MRKPSINQTELFPGFDGKPPPVPLLTVAPGAYLSTVSDETGGPLNAIEAERVTCSRSIRFAGKASVHGKGVLCRKHAFVSMSALGGFWVTIYSGTWNDEVRGQCATCGCDVVGETSAAMK